MEPIFQVLFKLVAFGAAPWNCDIIKHRFYMSGQQGWTSGNICVLQLLDWKDICFRAAASYN